MRRKLEKVKNILEKYHQEHLIQFYDELDSQQKDNLLDQILEIDFDVILNLYHQCNSNNLNISEEISPLPYINKNLLSDCQINSFSKIGEDAIRSGKLGIITLAGGQGSRLGCKGPKGTFELDTKPKLSLFEVICCYLKSASEKYHINIPWYIMTSIENYNDTVAFFKKHHFFGYPKDKIIFFKQSHLPVIDINAKLVLEETYKVKTASNGNGNLFNALVKYKLLDSMSKQNIEWLFVGGIDNVLLNPIDPLFLGLTIYSNNEIGSKTLLKEDPTDPNWIFARDKGKPSILDCENFVEQISQVKGQNGEYLYRETNMLAHLFHLSALNKLCTVQLPYHRAFRKNTFVNYEGVKQVPDSPNIYKFEQFIFDCFPYFKDILLLRVDAEKEFAPIKSFNGPYNPEIAKKMYEKVVLHIERNDDMD